MKIDFVYFMITQKLEPNFLSTFYPYIKCEQIFKTKSYINNDKKCIISIILMFFIRKDLNL